MPACGSSALAEPRTPARQANPVPASVDQFGLMGAGVGNSRAGTGLLAGGSVHFPTPPVSHLEEDSAVAQLRVAFAS